MLGAKGGGGEGSRTGDADTWPCWMARAMRAGDGGATGTAWSRPRGAAALPQGWAQDRDRGEPEAQARGWWKTGGDDTS
jgi:hypothetical protein